MCVCLCVCAPVNFSLAICFFRPRGVSLFVCPTTQETTHQKERKGKGKGREGKGRKGKEEHYPVLQKVDQCQENK